MFLCRFVKEVSIWACLAGMASAAKQLDSAETAYANIQVGLMTRLEDFFTSGRIFPQALGSFLALGKLSHSLILNFLIQLDTLREVLNPMSRNKVISKT